MNGEKKYIPYLKMITNIWSYSSFYNREAYFTPLAPAPR